MRRKLIALLCLVLCLASAGLSLADESSHVTPAVPNESRQDIPPSVQGAPSNPMVPLPPAGQDHSRVLQIRPEGTPSSPPAPLPPDSDIGSQIEKFLGRDSKGEGSLAEGSDNVITLNFKDVPLIDAIAVLSKQSSMNITLDRDVPNNLVVTSIYSGTSVENALRSITSANEIRKPKIHHFGVRRARTIALILSVTEA
jgi:hypothetical protein